MAAYTVQMKAEIVMLFVKNERRYTETRREFQGIHNCRDFPTTNSVKNWVDNFLKTENVEKVSIKPGLGKIEETEEKVADVLKSDPKTSVRRLSAMPGS